MAHAPFTLWEQAAEAVADCERKRARQVTLVEWRRAQGWDTTKAEAALGRIERDLAEKSAHLARFRPRPGQ